MPSVKSWYQSRTVWAAMVVMALGLLSLARVSSEDARSWLEAIAQIVAGAVALWGRVAATRRIAGDTGAGDSGDSGGAKVAGLVAVAALLAGMASGCSASQTYLTADRATYEAVAPEYLAYVTADAGLDQEQKDRRGRTVAAWKARLEAQP